MRKEALRPKEGKSTKGFAGREVLADLAPGKLTGRFSLKKICAAAASEALESGLTGEAIKDVLAALPKSRSR